MEGWESESLEATERSKREGSHPQPQGCQRAGLLLSPPPTKAPKPSLAGCPLEAAVTHGLLRMGLPRVPAPWELCVPACSSPWSMMAALPAALQTLHECFSFGNLEPVRKAIWEGSLQASPPFSEENEKEECMGSSHGVDNRFSISSTVHPFVQSPRTNILWPIAKRATDPLMSHPANSTPSIVQLKMLHFPPTSETKSTRHWTHLGFCSSLT